MDIFTSLQKADDENEKEKEKDETMKKYTNGFKNPAIELNTIVDSKYEDIDRLLEKEKQNNKLETWNKLDRTVKTQKLHAFAEKYGKDHNLPVKEIRALKQFFVECLEKNKLQKTKDVVYDKEKQVITSIPSLFFNTINHGFTLKNMDAKRVSTIKSLTPKRTITEKARDFTVLPDSKEKPDSK